MFKDKKEEKKFIEDAFDVIDRVKTLAGVDYEFNITIKEDDSGEEAYKVDGESVFAKVDVNVHYHRAMLTFFPSAVKTWKKKDFFTFTESLCHEVAHTITEPFQDLIYQTHTSPQEIRREVEYATEKIGRIMSGLYFKTYKKNLDKNGKYSQVIHKKRFDKAKKIIKKDN
jgi:hypothetical protein